MSARASFLVGTALTLMLGGCADKYPPGISNVLSGEECDGLPAGVSQLGFSDLARLRGNGAVVDPPGSAIYTGDLLMLGFSKGNQATTGYRLKVIDAEVVEQTATFTFDWQPPAQDTVVEDKTSSPCQVLAMDAGHFSEAVAVDQNGREFGRLLVAPTR